MYYNRLTSEIIYLYSTDEPDVNNYSFKVKKYILSQHPYTPTLYIDDYEKIEKTICVDGIGFSFGLEVSQKNGKNLEMNYLSYK